MFQRILRVSSNLQTKPFTWPQVRPQVKTFSSGPEPTKNSSKKLQTRSCCNDRRRMRPPFLSVPDFAFQFSLSPPPLLPPESLSLVFFSCWPMSLSFIFVSFLGRCPPSSFGSRGYNQKSAARLSIQVIDSLISRQPPDEYCARAVSISLDTLVCTSFTLFRDSKLLQR